MAPLTGTAAQARQRARRDHADKLFSAIVRARAGRCENCGAAGGFDANRLPTKGLTCAHIIPRRYSQVRCDFDNAVALCPTCADHFTGHPDEWRRWVIDRFGPARWDSLVERSNRTDRIEWGDVVDELLPQFQNLAPFSEVLLQQRKGRLHAEASDALHELVQAIAATGKGGKVTITLDVKPLGSGRQVTISDKVTVKLPEGEPDAVLWFMDDGNLSRRDPDQPQLPMQPVADPGDADAEEATG